MVIYKIIKITETTILDVLNGKNQGNFLEFKRFLDENFIIPENRCNIIKGYKILSSNQDRKISKNYENLNSTDAKNLIYCDHFISFFDEIWFGIANVNEIKSNDFHIEISNYKTDDNLNRDKIYARKGYELFAKNNNFYLFNSFSQDLLDNNNFKVLLLLSLVISNDFLMDNFKNKINKKFNELDIDEILSFRKKFAIYRIFDYEINEGRKESVAIFNKLKEYILQDKREVIMALCREIFDIKKDEFAINLEKEREDRVVGELEKNARLQKLMMIATFITILTLISVIADGFSIWDRMIKIFGFWFGLKFVKFWLLPNGFWNLVWICVQKPDWF